MTAIPPDGLTVEEAQQVLRRRVVAEGGMHAWARARGLTHAAVFYALNSDFGVSQKLALLIGLRWERRYFSARR